jgi:hypothetical protein
MKSNVNQEVLDARRGLAAEPVPEGSSAADVLARHSLGGAAVPSGGPTSLTGSLADSAAGAGAALVAAASKAAEAVTGGGSGSHAGGGSNVRS